MSFSISNQDMYLSQAFHPPQLLDPLILEMDEKEKSILEQEEKFIKTHSKHALTAFKVSMVVAMAGFGMALSMAVVPLFPLVAIPMIAVVGMMIGSVVGYSVGQIMDDLGASRRVAIYSNKIAQHRIDRCHEKLEKLNQVILDDSNKEPIDTAKKFVEKILEPRVPHNRVREFLNM